jgi:uncharacterized protein
VVTSEIGIALRPGGFDLRTPDRIHLGAVRYRWVTPYRWAAKGFQPQPRFRVPDYPHLSYPRPNAVVRTATHDLILIRLEVAASAQQRETGLMNRRALDADSGMIFVWAQETHDAFWMENTYIPLTVAFLAKDGTIQEMQDMAPLSTDLHMPELPYFYALEANQGYFNLNGIRVGDRFVLSLGAGTAPSALADLRRWSPG